MVYPTKPQVIAKLTSARNELEDALNLTAVPARYDPVVLPSAIRDELSAMRDQLDRIIDVLKQSQ